MLITPAICTFGYAFAARFFFGFSITLGGLDFFELEPVTVNAKFEEKSLGLDAVLFVVYWPNKGSWPF